MDLFETCPDSSRTDNLLSVKLTINVEKPEFTVLSGDTLLVKDLIRQGKTTNDKLSVKVFVATCHANVAQQNIKKIKSLNFQCSQIVYKTNNKL